MTGQVGFKQLTLLNPQVAFHESDCLSFKGSYFLSNRFVQMRFAWKNNLFFRQIYILEKVQFFFQIGIEFQEIQKLIDQVFFQFTFEVIQEKRFVIISGYNHMTNSILPM